ncbi:hypothetical protein DM02DRAFT_396024 [Periconia macrospinosa]|uniref:Uncharacterized protein n=1 Tax=Periconia macrospinosa TaxID=97972 RepID=A0A2V1DSJ1_9PLEO|nr:hypothetical protein DM02DRAFT_396024 [Periconia macrospinosa]
MVDIDPCFEGLHKASNMLRVNIINSTCFSSLLLSSLLFSIAATTTLFTSRISPFTFQLALKIHTISYSFPTNTFKI